jgi:hypothetical protein
MRRPRRTFSPEFRAKVALAALKGDKLVTELAMHRPFSNIGVKPAYEGCGANIPLICRTFELIRSL